MGMKEMRQQLNRLKADVDGLERRVAELEKRLQAAEPASDELGRRKTVRKKSLLRADYGTGKGLFSDIATDISEGGVRIETSRRHEAGLRLDLVFEVPNSRAPLKAKGEIVWVRELGTEKGGATQYAAGVRFLSMDDRTRHALAQFVASLPAEKRQAAFDEKDRAKWLDEMEESGL